MKKIIERPSWIIDGNYRKMRPLILSKATLAVILDLPPYLILWRVVIRTLGRKTGLEFGKITPLPHQVKKSGAGENVFEAFNEFVPKAIKFRKKRYQEIKADIEHHLGKNRMIILRKREEVDRFLYHCNRASA